MTMKRSVTWCVRFIVAAWFIAGAYASAAPTSYAEDRAAIENLISAYLLAMDTQNAEAFAATFASNGQLVLTGAKIPTPVTFRGRTKLRGFIGILRERTHMTAGSGRQFSPNIHFFTNLVLSVDGNHAAGQAYWFTVRRGQNHDLITEANPTPSTFASIGTYDESYVKENGRWLLESVTVGEMLPEVSGVKD
jgi:SnoaL-like domain